MRIGIDCRTMLDWRKGGESAGIGHYTYYLVKHLVRQAGGNEYVLFLDKTADRRIKEEIIDTAAARLSIRNFPFQALKRCLPFVYGHMVISSMFEKAKLDLLHAPANALPMFYRKPAVVTVHDLAVYDHPEWFPMKYSGALSFSERVIVPYSVKAARRVIAVSKHTKADLVRIFGIEESKIDVVYEGAEPPDASVEAGSRGRSFLKRARLDRGRYCLYLGTLEPRKNIPLALRAFVDLAAADYRRYGDLDFIIAGRKGWRSEPVFEAIDRANSELAAAAVSVGEEPRERVRYIGYLSHEDKSTVIGQAAVFLFPSLYEGFGLPVIEAMSLGVPVITSRRASLPEICGEAALLVDPQDAAEIAAALRRVHDDTAFAGELADKGRRRAADFNWERTAQETIKSYALALSGA